MQRSLPILVVVLALGLVGYHFLGNHSTSGSSSSAHAGRGLYWQSDWQAAVATSRESGRPILLNFGGPW